MSAWYIFSAMGFYPVDPVSGEYVVGSYVTFLLCYSPVADPCFAVDKPVL